jgi:hypothetical protein
LPLRLNRRQAEDARRTSSKVGGSPRTIWTAPEAASADFHQQIADRLALERHDRHAAICDHAD